MRAQQITVLTQCLDGNEIEIKAFDLEARVFQHEIDHLDGILFITKFQPAEKVILKQKLKELEKIRS